MNTSQREWIKIGEDPLRYEFGRRNDSPGSPRVSDQMAYVEEEKHSSYFHWETYGSHEKGARPSRSWKKWASNRLPERQRRREKPARREASSAFFRVEAGILTIAASKKDFENRAAARVQWVSLRVPSAEASGPIGAAKRVCERFRARWKKDLGPPSSDSLSRAPLWQCKNARLQARHLCLLSGENSRTEILLLTEPILLSAAHTQHPETRPKQPDQIPSAHARLKRAKLPWRRQFN